MEMVSRRALVLFPLLTLTPFVGPRAAAAADQRRLAVFLPNLPLDRPARQGVAQTLAKQISGALGIEVQARVYANLADLERELPAISFLFTESPLVAARALRPLAVAVSQGETTVQYALLARPAAEGSPLGRVAHTRLGRLGIGLIEGLLFEGDPGGHELRRTEVADAASAISLVRLGKASAVLLPVSYAAAAAGQIPGAQALFRSQRVPGLTLAQGGAAPGGGSALAGQLATALAGLALEPVGVQGFRPASQGDYANLAALLGTRHRMVLGPPALRLRAGRSALRSADLPVPAIPFAPAAPPIVPPR